MKQQQDDTEDMKKVLTYFDLGTAKDKLTLAKGVSMKDVKEKTGELQGFNYVLTSIAKDQLKSKKQIGETVEQRALIQQWLQYAVVLRGKTPPSELIREIDMSLASKTFLASHCMTLADPVLFLTLHPTFMEMSYSDKEKYPHLSRWFRLMQNETGLQKGIKKVWFSKMPLYNNNSGQLI